MKDRGSYFCLCLCLCLCPCPCLCAFVSVRLHLRTRIRFCACLCGCGCVVLFNMWEGRKGRGKGHIHWGGTAQRHAVTSLTFFFSCVSPSAMRSLVIDVAWALERLPTICPGPACRR